MTQQARSVSDLESGVSLAEGLSIHAGRSPYGISLVSIDAQAAPAPGERTWSVGDFDDACDAGQSLVVARRGGRVVGYAICGPGVGSRVWLVHRIVVDPGWRREGVGRELIASCMRARPGRRRDVFVEVSERNVDAQLFLRSCGFLWCHTNRNRYGSDDGMRFRRRCRSND